MHFEPCGTGRRTADRCGKTTAGPAHGSIRRRRCTGTAVGVLASIRWILRREHRNRQKTAAAEPSDSDFGATHDVPCTFSWKVRDLHRLAGAGPFWAAVRPRAHLA